MPDTNLAENNLVSLHGQTLQYIETLNSQNFKVIAIYSPIITLASAIIAFLTYTDLIIDKTLVIFIIVISVGLTIIVSFIGSKSVFNNWQSVLFYRQMLSRISQQISYLSSNELDLPTVNWYFSIPRTPKEYRKYMRRIVRFFVAAVYSLLNIITFVFLGIYTDQIPLWSSIGFCISLAIFYRSWLKYAFPLNNLNRKIRLRRFLINEYIDWAKTAFQSFYIRRITLILDLSSTSNDQTLRNEYRNFVKDYEFDKKLLEKKFNFLVIENIAQIKTRIDLRKESKQDLHQQIQNLRKNSKQDLHQQIQNLRKNSKQDLQDKLNNYERVKKRELRTQTFETVEEIKESMFDNNIKYEQI